MNRHEKANSAESYRNNVQSVQRQSVSGRVNDRRAGKELPPQTVRAMLDDGPTADDRDESREGQATSDEPDWADPDFEAHFGRDE